MHLRKTYNLQDRRRRTRAGPRRAKLCETTFKRFQVGEAVEAAHDCWEINGHRGWRVEMLLLRCL